MVLMMRLIDGEVRYRYTNNDDGDDDDVWLSGAQCLRYCRDHFTNNDDDF